jgi:hypothetical protein
MGGGTFLYGVRLSKRWSLWRNKNLDYTQTKSMKKNTFLLVKMCALYTLKNFFLKKGHFESNYVCEVFFFKKNFPNE